MTTLVEQLARECAMTKWARRIGRRWPSPTPQLYRLEPVSVLFDVDQTKEPTMRDITERAA